MLTLYDNLDSGNAYKARPISTSRHPRVRERLARVAGQPRYIPITHAA